MTARISFGEWLEDRLRERGWTQSAFGEQIGVARSTVSSWVNDVQPPRRRAIRDIARTLGVDFNEPLVRAGYPPLDAGYILPEERVKENAEGDRQRLDLDNPRTRFFAAYADRLSDDDWELLKRFIERLDDDGV